MTAELIRGDCREVLARFSPDAFDLAIVDPPYGTTSLEWDKPIEGLYQELSRVVRPTGSIWVFGQLRSLLEIGVPPGWKYAQEVVWEKHNGSNFHADRFRRVHELVVQFYPSSSPWAYVYKEPQFTNDATARVVRRKEHPVHMGGIEGSTYTSEDGGPRLARSVIFERSCHGYADHPTQKPVGLLETLIRYSCPSGGLVLDPTCGSGSTLIAARIADRSAIGIEIAPEYVSAARRRLDQGFLDLGSDVEGDIPF